MAFKDILLALTTYPDPTPVSAVDEPIAFAVAVGARISAIACEVNFLVPRISWRGHCSTSGYGCCRGQQELNERRKASGRLPGRCGEARVFQDRIVDRCLTSEVPMCWSNMPAFETSRLCPFPRAIRSNKRMPSRSYSGPGARRSSRPCPQACTDISNSTPWSWRGFQPACGQGLADALPLLEKAKQVRVVTVTNEKSLPLDGRRGTGQASGPPWCASCAGHVERCRRGIGEVLESYAGSSNADLIVMGAYGHSRVRDIILGGATKSMLSRPPVPIFLSH